MEQKRFIIIAVFLFLILITSMSYMMWFVNNNPCGICSKINGGTVSCMIVDNSAARFYFENGTIQDLVLEKDRWDPLTTPINWTFTP